MVGLEQDLSSDLITKNKPKKNSLLILPITDFLSLETTTVKKFQAGDGAGYFESFYEVRSNGKLVYNLSVTESQ